MENIKIALVCGLCEGCKHAINLAYDSKKTNKTVIFKEIVHNKNINNALKNAGLEYAENLTDIDKLSTAIIRAHGEPPETYAYFEKNDINYLDGTCKNVAKIHSSVKTMSEQDYKIIIIGKYGKFSGKIHPEVLGTAGYSLTPPIFIEDVDDVQKLKNIFNNKIYAVCQTTFNPQKFEQIKDCIIEICKTNNNKSIIDNTICGAQQAIQKSSKLLAQSSDIMIVVGGKNSSNSIELYKNLKEICPSIFIENINEVFDELKLNNLTINDKTKIGITAGASTDKAELIELKNMLIKYLSKN